MIVYLKNREIDREQWDNCIRNSSCVKPYPYSWYLDIISPGWEALVDDEYDSVFPMPVFGKFGIQFISTPVFLGRLGVYSPDKPAGQAIVEFLQYLPDFYRFIELDITQLINDQSFRIMQKAYHEIDLSPPYEILSEGFSAHCRRNIEIARRKETELVYDVKADELIDLFILNSGSAGRFIKPRDYQRLRELMNFCIINRKGRLLGVRSARKKLIYGLFVIETKGSVTILFRAQSNQGKERKAEYIAVNEIIMKHSGSRVIMEFPGWPVSADQTLSEEFGAFEKSYYRIYRNRLLWPGWLLR